jgi:NADPH:quinone reductase-like Zn-dependent oxidoreductase
MVRRAKGDERCGRAVRAPRHDAVEGMRSTVTPKVTHEAVAYWVRSPGVGELRRATVDGPGPEQVLVRSLYSGVSRGTETLVFRGEVPPSQHTAMRAPFQEGDFPGPVKYGYLNVGCVEQGPPDLEGRTVFCLHPHQSRYVVPADAVVPVPDSVPFERAVLGGMVETAVNALWDAPPLLGDRVAVVGAGVLGCCVARLLMRFPGVRATLVDVDPTRGAVGEALGVAFATPESAPRDQDLVFHTSATAAGLQTSLELVAPDSSVVDLSWYGDREVTLSLGGRFHSARLGIRASQVGAVAPARRDRRSTRDRLALALELLDDPAFDALLTSRAPLAELPDVMARLAAGDKTGIVHTVTYEEA